MTNKEFAFNYAGKEFMYHGDKVILVGYDMSGPDLLIASPTEAYTIGSFWYGDSLEFSDVITYKTDIEAYQYANLNELIFIDDEKPQTVTEVKPLTPGECIARYEGCQGMNYSVVNGCVSAMYKRQGSALKLVSRGDSINNVTEKI